MSSTESCNAKGAARYSKTYEDDSRAEIMRSGFEPLEGPVVESSKFALEEDVEDQNDDSNAVGQSDERQGSSAGDGGSKSEVERRPSYGSLDEARHVWGDAEHNKHDID